MIPAELRDFQTFVVSFSGGKDSQAVLLWALDHLPRDQVRIVHARHGASWPETQAHLDRIRRQYDIDIDVVWNGSLPEKRRHKGRTQKTFAPNLYEMVRSHGCWPRIRWRFCTWYLKIRPLIIYSRQFPDPVQLVGLRWTESKRRGQLARFEPKHPKTKLPTYYPILDMTDYQLWHYLIAEKKSPINPIYAWTARCSCWVCPLGRWRETARFARMYPDEFDRWVQLEKEIGRTWRETMSLEELRP